MALSLLAGCEDAADGSPKPQVLERRSCEYSGTETINVQCYWLKSKNGIYRLPLVRLSRHKNANNAIFYIPGGPGQGDQTSADAIANWLSWYQDANLDLDFVFYTPAGLPGSKPYRGCAEYERVSLALMAKNISYEQEMIESGRVLTQCLQSYHQWLMKMGVETGIRSLSTDNQARDLLQIAKMMAYDQWHVWGVSYGTRVALKVAELSKGNQLRPASLILDSVYPYREGRQSEWAAQQERSFVLHDQYYRQFGGQQFSVLWQNAKKSLVLLNRENKGLFTLENWWRGTGYNQQNHVPPELAGPSARPFQFFLTPHRLLALISFTLYDANILPEFYQALELLAEGDNRWQGAMTEVVAAFVNASFDPRFSSVAFFATECTDNTREPKATWESARARYPDWSMFLDLQYRYDSCKLPIFNSSGIGYAESGVEKALIVAGALDHVTPKSWAEALAERLREQGAEAELLVAPKTGHSVFNNNGCTVKLLREWTNGSQKLRSSNLQRYCNPLTDAQAQSDSSS